MSESDISTIDDVVTVKPVKKPKVEVAASADGKKYEMVTVYSSNEDGGTDSCDVTINGYLYQIPRDVPSRVPSNVVQVLRESYTTTYARNKDGEMVVSNRPRFAFSAVPA